MKPSRRPVLAVALVAMLATAGCSTLPTAPLLTDDSAATSSAGRAVNNAAGGVLQPPQNNPPTASGNEITATRAMNGEQGGSMSAGRVALSVPPGAFHGNAEIKIDIPDPSRLQCKLEITAGKNGFNKPVLLSFDARGFGDVRTLGIWWHNEASGEWELVESTGNPESGMVQALLPHFSEYRVDTQFKTKAGW